MHLDPSQTGRKINAGVREDGTVIYIQSDPLPRGAKFKDVTPGREDPSELAKLEATRKLGGLVPERSEFLDRLCRQIGELI